MPNIYVTNFNPEYDYSDTSRFLNGGQLINMTMGYVHTKDHEDELRERFAGFFAQAQPDDYILLSGHAILGVLAAFEWSRKFDGANLLYMHTERRNGKPTQHYRVCVVPAEDEEEVETGIGA